MTSFSTNLNKRLEARGWKAPHLCAALFDRGIEVGSRTVERWLEDECRPRSEILPHIAAILDCTIDDMFYKPIKPTNQPT